MFGQLFELIVGAVEGITLGSSAGAQSAATNRYISQIKQTQQRTAQEALTTKEQEAAFQTQTSQTQAQISELENAKMKQVAKIVVITTISVAIFGILIYYYMAVGRENA